MLILSRRLNESIIIDNNIEITVLDVNRGQIKIGIKAPENISVNREEIHRKINYELWKNN